MFHSLRLRQNFRTVQKHVGASVTVCAVVKADAYGHGAVECSRALEAEGARWLGVTSLDEAIPLREAGIRANILLMTGFWRGEENEIVRLHPDSNGVGAVAHRVAGKAAACAGRGATSGALEGRYRHGPAGRGASISFLRVLAALSCGEASCARRALDAPGIFRNHGRAFGGRAGTQISKPRSGWCAKREWSPRSCTWRIPAP